MFWFLACPCSCLPPLISFSHFNETNVEYLRKVRMLRGFCWKCSKLVMLGGCGIGVCSTRSSTATGATTFTPPAARSGVALQTSFWRPLLAVLGGMRLRPPLTGTSWQDRGRFYAAFPSCSSFCTELTYFCPAELSFWHFSQALEICLCITQVHIFNKEKGKSSVWPKNQRWSHDF